MSTVVIIGSPRKGNSETIALAMAEGAKENGNSNQDVLSQQNEKRQRMPIMLWM
jgi:multimeric flavodoxin WrbA